MTLRFALWFFAFLHKLLPGFLVPFLLEDFVLFHILLLLLLLLLLFRGGRRR